MARRNEENLVTVECIDCGVTFDIPAEEQAWYKDRGFELPKRCHRCRKARRNKSNNRRRK